MEASITLRKNNRGTTLAEMIVTFALIGIFMVSAAAVISSAILMHSEMSAVMYAQSVGELLLDKVTGELAAAQNRGSKSLTIEESSEPEGYDGAYVDFYDRDGRKVTMGVCDGRLQLHYDESAGTQDQGERIIDQEKEWQLDEKAYMGYRITELQIELLPNTNVVDVRIRLQNLKTGFEYATTRSTRCYHFEKWV